MATTGKSLSTISIESSERIIAQTKEVLAEPVNITCNILIKKLVELNKNLPLKYKVTTEIPMRIAYSDNNPKSNPGYGIKSRIRTDMFVVEEIRGSVSKYIGSIKSAINGIYMSADAQGRGIETFQRQIAAIEKDSMAHTKKIVKLFEASALNSNYENDYGLLVADAAMLRGDLRDMVKGMAIHLEDVARQEKRISEIPVTELQRK